MRSRRILIPVLMLLIVLALIPNQAPARPGALPGVFTEGDPDDLGHKATVSYPTWVVWLVGFTAEWLIPGATP